MERIKLLLQTELSNQSLHGKKFQGILGCSLSIYYNEGLLAYWKGNTLNVIRYFPTSAFMFGFHEFYKKVFPLPDKQDPKFLVHNMVLGGLSGCSSMIFVYPLDLLRTRITCEVSQKGTQQFSIPAFIKYIYQTNGLKGFYQGLGMSMVSNFSYRAMYFGFWEFSKHHIEDYQNKSFLYKFVIAQLVNGCSETINYPTDTIRRSLMMNSGLKEKIYKNTFDCILQIYRLEGIRGFYHGCLMNLIRSVSNSLLLVLYDELQKLEVRNK